MSGGEEKKIREGAREFLNILPIGPQSGAVPIAAASLGRVREEKKIRLDDLEIPQAEAEATLPLRISLSDVLREFAQYQRPVRKISLDDLRFLLLVDLFQDNGQAYLRQHPYDDF